MGERRLKKKRKRIIAGVLLLVMIVQMFPLSVMANPSSDKLIFSADGGENTITVTPKQEEPDEGTEEIFNNGILDFSCDVVTLDRDYAQTVKVKVTNKSEKMVQYYLEAENSYEDIYLNFVQEGSENAKMVIEPQETQEIELSVFLQNAAEDTYRIPITAYVNDGEEGFWSAAVQKRILFHCKQSDFNVSIVPQESGSPAQKAYRITNNGEKITDLTLSASDSVKDYLIFSPAIENYTLDTGESVSTTVSCDLGLMKENDVSNVEGELIVSSGKQNVKQSISFEKTDDVKEIDAWRLALYQEKSSYYTIDQPEFADNFETPNDSAKASMKRRSNEWTEERVIELCHLNMEEGGISEENPISLTATYPYIDEEGKQQQITIETNVFSHMIAEPQENRIKYKQTKLDGTSIGDHVACYVLTSANLKKADYLDAISTYLKEASNFVNLEEDAKLIFDKVWEAFSGKEMGGGEIFVKSIIRDTAWDAFEVGTKDYTKDILEASKGISKVFGDMSDAAKAGKYMAVISNPTIEKSEKDKASAHLLMHMASVGIKAIKSTPQGKVSFFTAGPEKAIEILNKMDEIRYSDMSDEEFGLYFQQLVYGSQCTNVGSVKSQVKINSLARGMQGFWGMNRAYYQLGNNSYTNAEILELFGNSKSKRKRNTGLTEDDFASHPDANVVVTTGRLSNEALSYAYQDTTNQIFKVNGTQIGSITTNGLSGLYNVALVTDTFQQGVNTVIRDYDTNPGSYKVTADTEYNTLVPDDSTLFYSDSLDTLDDIRCIPDFAIYAENIRNQEKNIIGEKMEIPFTIYNRGPRGGWTDVSVTAEGETVYTEKNVYVGPFGSADLSFTMTPQKERNKITVSLENKTEYVEERTIENNTATKVLRAEKMEAPEIVKISPELIELKETDKGAFVSALFKNGKWMKSVQFSLDEDAWTETYECDGKDRYAALLPIKYLAEKDSHTLKVIATYQDGTSETKTISGEIPVSVKIKKGISFTCVGRYPRTELVVEKEDAFEKIDPDCYEIVSHVTYDDKTKQTIYQESIYFDESYKPSEDCKVFIVGNDERMDLIPLNKIQNKEISGNPSGKVMVTADSENIRSISVSCAKLNGKMLPGYCWLDKTVYIGEGISDVHLKINYSCNGHYQTIEKDLDELSSEQTIHLQDTSKKVVLTNASGDLTNALLIMKNQGGSESSYGLSVEQTEDGQSVICFDDAIWKNITNAKTVSLVCSDNSAIYQIDPRTMEGSVDLKELKKDYHKISYKESDAKIQKSVICLMNYDFTANSDTMLLAPGDYQIETDYTINGVALHNRQEITIADQDVVLELPENSSETTVTLNWSTIYDLVQVSYDSPDGWVNDQTVENGQKIVCQTGEQNIYISARLKDGSNINISKTVDIAENTNTNIELSNQFHGNVTALMNGEATQEASVEAGKQIVLSMSELTDGAGNNFNNYYQGNGMKPTLILTNIRDESNTVEINAEQNYYYLDNWSNYTFTVPKVEGTYRYRIEWKVPIMEHVHVLQKITATEADCETDGNIEYYLCEECGGRFKDAEGTKEISEEDILIPAKGHHWGEWIVIVPATEEQEGQEQRVCENNSTHAETRVIPKLTHTHELVFVLAKEATYEADGNIAYYHCKCGRIFADENGEKELTEEDVVIPKLVQHIHSITKVGAKEATCEEAGNREYYYCDLCGKYFEDTNGEKEVSKDDLIILPKGHDWGEWTISKEPTADEPGEMIRVCKNDNNHVEKQKIPPTGQPEQPDIDYQIIRTGDLVWTKDSNKTLPLFIRRTPEKEGSLEHFRNVTVDGTRLDSADYDIDGGENPGTVLGIQLWPSCLQKLANGEHVVQVIFDDGKLDVKLKIVKQEESGGTNSPDTGDGNQNSSGKNEKLTSDTTSSKTGDSADLTLWITLSVASIAGAGSICVIKRKKKR